MRILIIEDEAPLLERVAAQLREQGYAVDTAADGRTGCRIFRASAGVVRPAGCHAHRP